MGGAVVDDGPTGIKAPDGGWSWIVLVGCFVITGFSYSFPKALSVYYHELIDEFGVGYSDTTLISSILLAMLYGTGPLCSVCVNWFGCRPVIIAGGLLASTGMVAASFCHSIITLYITAGIVTGLGLALSFQPSLIMLNRYFDKRRPLANGLAAAGSPVFLSCLSPLGQYLLGKYGWRGGFLIFAGLLLNCCACGALMRPLLPPKNAVQEVEVVQKKPKKKLLDFTVFKDKGFLIYTVACAIMVLGLFVPPVFVVNYGKDIGVPDTKAALLLTILGCVDIFSRPTCGVIAGLERVRPYTVYLFGFAMIFNGFTDLMGSMSNSFGGLVVFCIFFGISYGMVGALQFEVLMTVVGTQKFSSAIGLVLLVEACTVLIGPPSAGKILDSTGAYMFVFITAGVEVAISSLIIIICNFFFLQNKTTKDPHCVEETAETGQVSYIAHDSPENIQTISENVKLTNSYLLPSCGFYTHEDSFQVAYRRKEPASFLMEPSGLIDALNSLGSRITALTLTVQELQANQAFLQEQLHDLQPGVPTPTSPPAASAGPSASGVESSRMPEPRVLLPDCFNGERTKYRAFITACELLFAINPHTYSSDFIKVRTVIALLTEEPQAWGHHLLQNNSPVLASWNEFRNAMDALYDDPFRSSSAQASLRTLSQGRRPAEDYVTDFRRLSCDTNWKEATLFDQFRLALADLFERSPPVVLLFVETFVEVVGSCPGSARPYGQFLEEFSNEGDKEGI
ncbi:monocarboxylate transporter 4-like [Rhinophrynus dorsalis]